MDGQDIQDYFRSLLSCNPVHPCCFESASRAAASPPVYPVYPCSLGKEYLIPRAPARGSSKPRMRRPHLAVGVSPWKRAPMRRLVSASSISRCLIYIDGQDIQDYFRSLLSCNPVHPCCFESALRAAASPPVYPVYPCSLGKEYLIPRAPARGSSKPRMRRPHLAVGVSPWKRAASPPSRVGGDST